MSIRQLLPILSCLNKIVDKLRVSIKNYIHIRNQQQNLLWKQAWGQVPVLVPGLGLKLGLSTKFLILVLYLNLRFMHRNVPVLVIQ